MTNNQQVNWIDTQQQETGFRSSPPARPVPIPLIADRSLLAVALSRCWLLFFRRMAPRTIIDLVFDMFFVAFLAGTAAFQWRKGIKWNNRCPKF